MGARFQVVPLISACLRTNDIALRIIINILDVIIIVTRPKPAYGRQGLAGSWGQDTDEVSTFWCS